MNYELLGKPAHSSIEPGELCLIFEMLFGGSASVLKQRISESRRATIDHIFFKNSCLKKTALAIQIDCLGWWVTE